MITYTLCSNEDLSQVIHINETCLHEHYSLDLWKSWLESFADTFLVAKDNNAVIGYAIAIIENDKWKGLASITSIEKVALIASVAVIPEYRRKKIGRTLLTKLIETLIDKDVADVLLQVRVSNVIAQQMYHTLGFKYVKVLPNYYMHTDKNEDAVLMAKKLGFHLT